MPAAPSAMPAAGREFAAQRFSVSVPDNPKDEVIVLAEKQTGKVAIKRIANIPGVWKLSQDDWKIAQLEVEAFSRGLPIPAGTMDASAGDFTQSQPIENGKAVFFAAPPKDIQLVVHYISAGAQKKSPPQSFRLNSSEPAPRLALTITDPVDGVGVAQRPNAQKRDTGSPLGGALVWIISLAIAAAALYFGFQLLRKNEEAVAANLRKLGVQIPGETQADGDAPTAAQEPFQEPPLVPEGHCAYCGQQLAADGSCACQVGKAAAIPRAPSGMPALVGDGLSLEIPPGVSVIGREGDLKIAESTVSRRHAEIRFEGGSVVIKDLGSANGTFVNGAAVASEVEIQNGDTIQLGALKLRLQL